MRAKRSQHSAPSDPRYFRGNEFRSDFFPAWPLAPLPDARRLPRRAQGKQLQNKSRRFSRADPNQAQLPEEISLTQKSRRGGRHWRRTVFARIRSELGDVDMLLYHAATRPFGRPLKAKPRTLGDSWRLATFGAFLCAQQVVPAMLAKGPGAIIISGATTGVKPFVTSAAIGPAKLAVRGLAQVMACDLS
jgi:NAD(P)-dependent dehydrogenase (short-subunit alcohol dehydrogenase family)